MKIASSECIALTVNDEGVSLEDVLRLAKWRSQLEFIQSATDAALIRQAAADQSIEVSDEELQQAANDFRIAHDLHNAQSTKDWLHAKRLTFADWEQMLEDDTLARKMRDRVTEGKIEQHFAENRLSFDAAIVSQIVVAGEDIARELRLQITEEGADFHKLAREHSTDPATKAAGGYFGAMRRTNLDAQAEAALFGAARETKITNPVKTDEGWRLFKIESLQPATLDDDTREAIKSQLFEEWLAERRRKARIHVPLLETADE